MNESERLAGRVNETLDVLSTPVPDGLSAFLVLAGIALLVMLVGGSLFSRTKGADEAAAGGEEVEEAHASDEVQILGPDGRPAKR